MNIAYLEYFLTASRTLNYTQAAKRHFTSRQNLSHGIREIERELGVALFVQSGGRLALTAEGEEAAKHAAVILNEVERLRLACAPPERAEKPLSVVVMSNIFSFSPYDVTSVFDKAPEGRLRVSELNCEECCESVAAGRFDVALVACMERDFPGCETKLIHEDFLYILLPEGSPLAAKRELNLTDLKDLRMHMPPGYEIQFEPLMLMLRARNFNMEDISPIATFSVVKRAVERGEAVGISSALFADDPPDGTIARPLAVEGTKVGLRAVYRRSSPKKHAVRELIDSLEASLPC